MVTCLDKASALACSLLQTGQANVESLLFEPGASAGPLEGDDFLGLKTGWDALCCAFDPEDPLFCRFALGDPSFLAVDLVDLFSMFICLYHSS